MNADENHHQSSSESLFNFVSNLATSTVSDLITGTVNTVSDAADGARCLMKGNYRDAADIAAGRVGRIAHGAVNLVRNGAAVTVACCDTLLSDPTSANKNTENNT